MKIQVRSLSRASTLTTTSSTYTSIPTTTLPIPGTSTIPLSNHPAASPFYSNNVATPLSIQAHIQHKLKQNQQRLFAAPMPKYAKVILISTGLLSSVMFCVFAANALVVYQKEDQIRQLFQKRDELRNKLEEQQ